MSGKRREPSALRISPRTENLFALVSLITIPCSLVCLYLAKHTIFPSGLLRELWGPKMDSRQISSFPDYAEWDIATMMLTVAASGISAIYLVVWIIRGPRRESQQDWRARKAPPN